MGRKIIAMACAVAGVLGIVVAAAPAQAKNPEPFTDRLPAGQCLTWDNKTAFAQLDSPSRRFTLWISGASFVLDNNVKGPHGGGDAVWRMDLDRRGRTASLCMQTDGNLVWRLDHKAVWSSRTSGRGNTVRLLDSGGLVVRNRANHTLWSSGTTAVILRTGDVLASGRTLVNRQTRSGTTQRPRSMTRLEMTRGGDLVLRAKNKRVWHSNTHVRGSTLLVRPDGRIVVRSPSGRTVWRSPTVGTDPVLVVASKGRITLRARHCWVRPRASGDCYTG